VCVGGKISKFQNIFLFEERFQSFEIFWKFWKFEISKIQNIFEILSALLLKPTVNPQEGLPGG